MPIGRGTLFALETSKQKFIAKRKTHGMETLSLNSRRGLTVSATAAAVWSVLVVCGVLGRLWQPEYNLTPLAALTLFGSLIFAERWLVAVLPLTILTISNFWLPDYNSRVEMIVIYGCFLIPVAFHGWLRQKYTFGKLALIGGLPSLAFFAITNGVVWYIRRGVAFDDSLSGLADCYAVALPFYRWMLAGDIFYMVMLFSGWSFALRYASRQAPVQMRPTQELVSVPVTG
jgi:hypothetical protein